MKSDMMVAIVFKMIEMRGRYGVQKVMKKVLEKRKVQVCLLSVVTRERIESLMGVVR
jgi:hypothetical protein